METGYTYLIICKYLRGCRQGIGGRGTAMAVDEKHICYVYRLQSIQAVNCLSIQGVKYSNALYRNLLWY